MANFEKVPGFSGLCVITPVRHMDARGFFAETYHAARYAEAGIDVAFVQDNHSRSEAKGTIRGLHFQKPPHAQDKLVSCVRGRLLDVVVDIRRGSPSFGRSFSVELSPENGKQLFVPAGFAHGFCALEDGTEISYKVSDFYAPESDAGMAFDDPQVAIEWPVSPAEIILSDKDRQLPVLAELSETLFQFQN